MIRSILKTMRPHQWVKNGAIFAALIFDRQLVNADAFLHTLAGFFLFSLLSGSIYIINDVKDIEADRNHPKKKFRPIASGKISTNQAIFAAVILLGFTIPVSFYLKFGFGIIAFLYFLNNLLYSNWMKHIPLIDVMSIAAGFVLRVAAGVSLIQVERFSPWLYVVTTLLALLLGFGKRRGELALLTNNANGHRKVLDGYSIPFLDQLITIVSCTTLMAYSLYTFSAPNVPENHSMMLTIPFVLYGIFRYLYVVQVKKEGGDPTEILLRDHPLQATVMLWGLSVLIVFYMVSR